MKFMNILFGLLLAAFVSGNIFRIQITPHIALIPIDLVALCWLGLTLKNYRNLIDRIQKDSITKWGAIFIAFGSFSLLLNVFLKRYDQEQYGSALLYGVRFLAYLSIYFSLRSLNDVTKQKYQKWLLLSLFGILVTGWLQYLLYPDLRNLYYLGWDEHYFRMFGAYFDPNFAGAIYVLTIWVFVAMKTQLRPLAYYLGIVLCLGAIALTYSRSSYLMLIVSALTYVIIQKKYKEMAIGLLLFGVVLGVMPKQGRGEGVNLFRSASIIARFTEYQAAIGVIKQDPIIGVGYNAYGASRENKQTMFSAHAAAGLPNSWLFVIATTGFVGFILYLAWWKAMIQQIMKSSLMPYLIPATFGLWVHALFESTLFYAFILCMYLMLVAFGTHSQTRAHSLRSAK